MTANSEEPVVIKKYATRRLYDTGRSDYTTLDDVAQLVKDGKDFIVVNAKSGQDITRSILAQIIVEQEAR
jgi:polyhydroxyalkanoate synthesis repressor PhaR